MTLLTTELLTPSGRHQKNKPTKKGLQKGEREMENINGKPTSEHTSQQSTKDTHRHSIINQGL